MPLGIMAVYKFHIIIY